MGLVVFGVWVFLLKKLNMDVSVARGYIMALMVFMQNIHVFNCRSEKKSVFKTNPFSNPFILVAIFGSIGLQLIIMNVPFLSHILRTEPISASHMFMLFLMAIPVIVLMEIFKVVRKKKY